MAITIRNIRQQVVHLEKKQGDKHVLLVVPARSSVVIANSEMSQDIQIKSERGDIQLTVTADEAPATAAEPVAE